MLFTIADIAIAAGCIAGLAVGIQLLRLSTRVCSEYPIVGLIATMGLMGWALQEIQTPCLSGAPRTRPTQWRNCPTMTQSRTPWARMYRMKTWWRITTSTMHATTKRSRRHPTKHGEWPGYKSRESPIRGVYPVAGFRYSRPRFRPWAGKCFSECSATWAQNWSMSVTVSPEISRAVGLPP